MYNLQYGQMFLQAAVNCHSYKEGFVAHAMAACGQLSLGMPAFTAERGGFIFYE